MMTVSIVPASNPQVVISDEKSTVQIELTGSSAIELIAAGPQGPPGDGVAGNNDVGVIYLKNNAVPTTIASINGRAVVEGTMLTGELYNFEKDAGTNSLKYNGPGGRFHIVATFNFYEGSQTTCGFYIGISKNPNAALDPDGDRISESEVYANASTPSNQPQSGAVQTVQRLDPGDRIFFIVQNKDSTGSITVEFLKLIATSLTSERGAPGPRSITIVDPQNDDEFTLLHAKEDIVFTQVLAVVRGTDPSVTYEVRYDADRSASGVVAIGPSVVTSTTAGDTATVQNMPVPSGSFVWLKLLNVSGVVGEFNFSAAF
jgi:hypothetical protein